jgi:hypothetical protein
LELTADSFAALTFAEVEAEALGSFSAAAGFGLVLLVAALKIEVGSAGAK